MMADNINCIKCKNYYVTWDNSLPKGCKLFGFKSRQLPSVLVKQATGAECKNYEEKLKNSK